MISEEVWSAWHAGQVVPYEADWKKLSNIASRTAEDVVRQSCAERFEREINELRAQRAQLNARIDARIAVLEPGLQAARSGGDWIRKVAVANALLNESNER